MAATMLWKKFDCITDSRVFLDCSDECFYARDYISHGAYDSSEGNDLISNFKKRVSRRGMADWKWKTKAIRQFAQEITTSLQDGAVIAAIPTSKTRSDPEYDSRLDDVLRQVVALNGTIRIDEPIERSQSVQALHHGGMRRINDVLQTLEWVGFDEVPPYLVLIDDLITCGSSFKACQRLIHQHHPGLTIYGVFWARTVWSNESADVGIDSGQGKPVG